MELMIGDAVRMTGSLRPTMLIYDWADEYRTARCNWLVEGEMRKRNVDLGELVFVARGQDVREVM